MADRGSSKKKKIAPERERVTSEVSQWGESGSWSERNYEAEEGQNIFYDDLQNWAKKTGNYHSTSVPFPLYILSDVFQI